MDKISAYTGTADVNDEFTEGDPAQAIQATEVDEGWLNGVQRELLEVMTQMGLTPSSADDTLVWQALQKVYGKTHAGNPQGNVAADVLRERCWDTSQSPPALYVATAADGTVGGTTWTRLVGAASTTLRGQVELATDAETQAGTDSQRAVTPAGLAATLASSPSVQVFSSSGTWNRPAGCRNVLVEVQGAGGGGGGSAAAGSSNASAGAGGGGGGYSCRRIDVTGISSATITVGAGGSGGSAGANNGSNGGDSSWADGANTVTGAGGDGGAGRTSTTAKLSTAGASGGTGTGGDFDVRGQRSNDALADGESTTDYGWGSTGGSSMFGAGGIGTISVGGVTNHGGGGRSFGGGGGGGSAADNGVAAAGGDGANGLVNVWEFY